jgi:peptide/nickel transport system permease protein
MRVSTLDVLYALMKTVPDLQLYRVPSFGWGDYGVSMALDKKPYSDVRVRQALSMAINRDIVAEVINRGDAALYGPFPWALAGYTKRGTTRTPVSAQTTSTTSRRPRSSWPRRATPTVSTWSWSGPNSRDGPSTNSHSSSRDSSGDVGLRVKLKQLETSTWIAKAAGDAALPARLWPRSAPSGRARASWTGCILRYHSSYPRTINREGITDAKLDDLLATWRLDPGEKRPGAPARIWDHLRQNVYRITTIVPPHYRIGQSYVHAGANPYCWFPGYCSYEAKTAWMTEKPRAGSSTSSLSRRAGMRTYVARRVLQGLLVLWLVSLAIFSLVRILPGDAVIMQLDQAAAPSPEALARARQELGLERPFLAQYRTWITGCPARGPRPLADHPSSCDERARQAHQPDVAPGCDVDHRRDAHRAAGRRALGGEAGHRERLPGPLLRHPGPVAPGLLARHRRPSRSSQSGSSGSRPSGSRRSGRIPRAASPSSPSRRSSSGLGWQAVSMRMTRSSLLEVLRQDYIRTARAKGARERAVIVRHALKNAFIPVVTVIGQQFSVLLGGTVIVEFIFLQPGVGSLMLDAVLLRDYTLIQGAVLFFAAVIVAMNLLVDLSYAWLDPRIRYR